MLAAAYDGHSSALAFGRDRALDGFDPLAKGASYLIGGAELGRDRQRQDDLGGHRTVLAKEVQWPPSSERTTGEQASVGVHTGPVMDTLD